MINAILGKKIEQSQRFLEDGTRIPVTIIEAGTNVVTAIKEKTFQLGFGINKRAKKSLEGQIKKAGIEYTPRFFREVAITGEEMPKLGAIISIQDVFKPGDLIDVVGVSKGKGFAGVVKRWGFAGGPRTHGQSDRERAPGSIGQTTTPGRVYKGKKMAGRMGNRQTTIKNLEIVDIVQEKLIIKGLVPGGKNKLVIVKKIGEDKKFIPLWKEVSEEEGKNVS